MEILPQDLLDVCACAPSLPPFSRTARSDWRGAAMQRADFSHAMLRNCDMRGVNLEGTHVPCRTLTIKWLVGVWLQLALPHEMPTHLI